MGAPPTLTVFSFWAKEAVPTNSVKAKQAVAKKFLVFIMSVFLKVINPFTPTFLFWF
jgi:hypothetical protein